MNFTRRRLMSAMASTSAVPNLRAGDGRGVKDDLDYGGQWLNGVEGIEFTDGSTQTTAPSATSTRESGDSFDSPNLTSLVENGTYSDIAEAIANEPPKHPEGSQLIIEPGTYHVDSTGHLIDWSGRSIQAKGVGSRWSRNAGYPVTIEVADSVSDEPITIGTRDAQQEAIGFDRILFRSKTKGGAQGVFAFDADAGAVTRAIDFNGCGFWGFAGGGVVNKAASSGAVYDLYFDRCLLKGNSGTFEVGSQCEFHNCYLATPRGTGVEAYQHTYWVGGALDAADEGLKVGHGSYINARNFEGNGVGTAIVVKGGGAKGEHTVIFGHIHGWDVGLTVKPGRNSRVQCYASFYNINDEKVRFEGAPGDHNRSMLFGRYDVDDVNYARSNAQNLRIFTSEYFGNVTSLPVGFFGIDADRGGTGKPALIYGGDRAIDRNSVHYWDRDGTID